MRFFSDIESRSRNIFIKGKMFFNSPKLRLLIILLVASFPSYSALQKICQILCMYFKVEESYSNFFSLLIVIIFTIIFSYLFIKILDFFNNTFSSPLKYPIILIIIIVIVLILLFFFIYPAATSGRFGPGSDRDEALNIAVNALLQGKYPYYLKTFVPGLPHLMGGDGNPISPFPGELFISIPFVLIGNGAYQTFFWLLCAAWLIKKTTNNSTLAFVTLLAASFLSVGSIYEIVSGGDLLVNGLWVFCSYLFLFSLRKGQIIQLYGMAFVLGLVFSTRLNFLVIAPFAFGWVAFKYNLKTAIKFSTIVALSFLVITLPFYLFDPRGFSPLHAYSKLGRFDSLLPYNGVLVPVLTTLLSFVFILKLKNSHPGYWFISMAFVLFIPIGVATILDSLTLGEISFIDYSWYGLSYIYFIVFGFLIQDRDDLLLSNADS